MDSSINLYVLDNGEPVEAPKRDLQVASGYDRWADKGEVLDGRRVTILTEKTVYAVNEEVRVIHVLEIVEPGHPIYVMGPKAVFDEYVNGEFHGEPPSERDDDVFMPAAYDGRVQESPGLDFNFEITSFRFSEPGTHRIRWQPGRWKSNVLEFEVS
ncbi:MAG: hypothetical protein V3T84_01390 [Phycisphaerales bacterium]